MKQPKVFTPDLPPPAPPLTNGPRYRYFSTPPATVKVRLGDLAGQIPTTARKALFDDAREVELPAESILKGPIPKIRLSQLAELIPDALNKTEDSILRLPIARLAVNYRFTHRQELIEEKPLPPLEPLISSEGSFIPDTLEETAPPVEDTPPESFAPPAPQIAAPGLIDPPSAPALAEATPSVTPPSETGKPQGKKIFSILPMFRRKEQAAPVQPAPPAPAAPPESRHRVEIPKPRTVLPPITARVAEATSAPPPPPLHSPTPVIQPPAPEEETFLAEEPLPLEAESLPPSEEEILPEDVSVEVPAAEVPVPPVRPTGPLPSPKAVWVEAEHLTTSQLKQDIPDQDGLQAVFMTEELLSVERVLELSGALPGIKSCVLSQGRAVVASHNVPDNIDLVSLSANAVEMLHAMRQSAARMGVGAIPAVTIHSDKGPITFFHQEDLCLLVMHKDRGFVPGVREKLQQVVQELSRAHLTLPVAPVKPSLGE